MDNVYFADLIFEAKKEIKSLPSFHGARFSALLRFACQEANVKLEEICFAVIPFRDGTKHIKVGKKLRVRLLINDYGAQKLGLLCNALTTIDGHGEFSASSLELIYVQDGITRKNVEVDENGIPKFRGFDTKYVNDEVRALMLFRKFSIYFYTPARFVLPAGMKPKNPTDEEKLCTESFFYEEPTLALPQVISSVRLLDPWQFALGELTAMPKPYGGSLEWMDMNYNQDRHVHMGGIVGSVKFEGRFVNEDIARRLVLGQYFGIGKNPLFSLGFYKIDELDPVRDIFVPKMRN